MALYFFAFLSMACCNTSPKVQPGTPLTSTGTMKSSANNERPAAKYSLGHFVLPNLDYKTVMMAVYPDTIMEIQKTYAGENKYHYDTLFKGRTRNVVPYNGEEEYYAMNPLITVEYTENDTTKAAVFFEGTFMHQHGHNWQDVQVFFFMKQKNDTWLFLDSLAMDEFDVDEVEEMQLCKKGFTLRIKSSWDNMGAFSEREVYWTFQHEKLVNGLYFWTLSGRMSEEEPYENESSKATVVMGNDPAKEWQTVYYYAEKYGCTQQDAEDDLEFCSSKWIYENGKYRVYPLTEKERP